jgi:hypothetical protein
MQGKIDLVEELQAYLEETPSVSESTKTFWQSVKGKVAPLTALDILAYFKEFPGKIEWATELLKKKITALSANDPALWHRVLSEEELELKQ